MQFDTQNSHVPAQNSNSNQTSLNSLKRPNPEKYLAKEGVSALSHAFGGKIAMHPGMGGGASPAEEIQPLIASLLQKPLQLSLLRLTMLLPV